MVRLLCFASTRVVPGKIHLILCTAAYNLARVLRSTPLNTTCAFTCFKTCKLLVLNESRVECTNVNESGVDGEHQGATNEFQLISVGR